MHSIDENQEALQTSNTSADLVMQSRHSLDIRHSLDYSRSRRSSSSQKDTDQIIQHLHARLNNIAVMWKVPLPCPDVYEHVDDDVDDDECAGNCGDDDDDVDDDDGGDSGCGNGGDVDA